MFAYPSPQKVLEAPAYTQSPVKVISPINSSIAQPFIHTSEISNNNNHNNNIVANPSNSSEEEQTKGYKLLSCIGRGNFGDVYKAFDFVRNEVVAIKAINIEQSDDDIPVLLQEINLLRSLKHPNITNLYNTFVIDVTMFIVMEYCNEGSCSDLLKFNKNGLNENLLSYIMKNVLEGLKYLHDLNIIHRDIKAANILITKNHAIKLADFGVSGQLNGITGKKTFVGTPYWMAPEIITDCSSLREDRNCLEERLKVSGLGHRTLYKIWKRKMYDSEMRTKQKLEHGLEFEQKSLDEAKNDDHNIDNLDDVEYNEKVDIWSLGITLIELGTGKVPNNNKEPLKALFAIPKMDPPTVPETSSYYMKEFSLACLCKDPNIRCSASELLKFKFITKNRVKPYDLSVLSGHSEKLKRKKPKFMLDLNNSHYGPAINWDLDNIEEETEINFELKNLNAPSIISDDKENENENMDSDLLLNKTKYQYEYEQLQQSPDEEHLQKGTTYHKIQSGADEEEEEELSPEDDTFANNSFFGNPPPIRYTADTSPLLGGHHNPRYREDSIYNSANIRQVMRMADGVLHLDKDTHRYQDDNCRRRETLQWLDLVEEALIGLCHSDGSAARAVFRGLGTLATESAGRVACGLESEN